MNVEQTRHTWRIAGISLAVLILLTLVLYQQTVQYLIVQWNQWETGTYAHGYLVIAVSIYLVFRNRQKLSALTPWPNLFGLLAVLAASVLWILAILVDVQMLQTVSLLLLLLAIVWTTLGNRVTGVLLFPILFIGFAIPIWSPLSPLLQDLTADVVFSVIRMIEVPAFRQENMIVLPGGKMSIEEACSGLRYLLAALTLGALYAYLNYEKFYSRLMVLLISAAAAVLANFLRVFVVVYLGYTTDMQHPLVHDHLMLGWYLFGVLVFILMFIDTRLYRHYQGDDNAGKKDQKVTEEKDSSYAAFGKGNLHYLGVIAVAAMIVSAAPAIVYSSSHKILDGRADVEFELPAGSGGWAGPVASDDDWMPVYHGAVTKKKAYQKGVDRIILYIGYYPVQTQGVEVINETNKIANKGVWEEVYPRARLRQEANQQVLEQLLVRGDGKQRLVWYWYRVAGQISTNKYEAKILQLLGIVTGKPQAFVAAVAVDSDDNADYARMVLHEFLLKMGASLDEVAIGGL